MFHNHPLSSVRSTSPVILDTTRIQPQTGSTVHLEPSTPPARLTLVPSGGGPTPAKGSTPLVELIAISAHRCSSFFAEAAVLVLVLALLDRFMLKGRMELGWTASAFTISLTLLAASIATDFSARRWLQRH
ncbi:hypothetical protein EDE15_1744 [Edaphobacter aggregans]|uniref:Uncharacterized protein n=1 Tax=Edaphobacter aggregans TaxID=570835 RepID=A0A428MHN3_9BACT|nr:hypothetical protein [Edaphobacter aggregans]RSL16233.1 hypothetical protein EDE15_1744 [Edaphobacter aggregans]